MDKLEVGMYVRTDKGRIGKVLTEPYEYKDDYNQLFKFSNDIEYSWDMDFEDILKASHNIIDLIEVGDYVNGHLVTKISKDKFIWLEGYSIDRTWHYVDYINEFGDNIKSILTKEQFSNMEYRIGD